MPDHGDSLKQVGLLWSAINHKVVWRHIWGAVGFVTSKYLQITAECTSNKSSKSVNILSDNGHVYTWTVDKLDMFIL